MLIKPPEDGADHESSGSRRAVLSRDVSLLCQPCGHVIHDGHNDANGLLRYRYSLGQLELRTKELWWKFHWLTVDLLLGNSTDSNSSFLHYFILIKRLFSSGKCKDDIITASLVSWVMTILTKKSILVLSTTAIVPGGAMGGALGGIVRQNWTFHFSWAAWSGNCRSKNN